MNGFLVIFISLFAGLCLQRSSRFPAGAAHAFNSFVIALAYPAVILVQVPALLDRTPIDGTIFIPVSMPWICFALSWLFFSNLGKWLGWSRGVIGALILTSGLGNTSFVGFPLLEALLGPDSLRTGILNDQPGSFLVLSTLGLFTAATYAGSTVSLRSVMRRILTFPPFIALVLAIVWWAIGTKGSEVLNPALERIGSTLVPVALFAVGLQMRWSVLDLRALKAELTLGLAFKLFLSPLFFYALYFRVLGASTLASRATVLESAMAPMITAAIVATEFDLEPRLANLMVGIGIPISLITVSLLNYFLS